MIEKLNDGKSVRVEDDGKSVRVEEESNPQGIIDDNVLPSEVTKTRRRFWFCFYLLLLVMVCLFATRVPYIGSFPDSYLFEFVFGNLKYLIYAFIIVWIIFKLFRLRIIKIFKTKRFILGFVLCIVGFILVLAILQKYLLVNESVTLNTYISGFTSWSTSKDAQIYHSFMPTIWPSQPYLDAGIIATLLAISWEYIAAILLAIVALIFIGCSFLVFINRKNGKIVNWIKKWLIHLLGGNVYNNVYDELSPNKHDIDPVIHNSVEIKQEANKFEQLTPPISFLTDTSQDNYFNNKNRAEKLQHIINKFIRKISIDAAYRKTLIMPQYAEISFEVASKSQIDDILKMQNELLHMLQVDTFNIVFKGNVVKFEIPHKEISKISIRQILNSVSNIQTNEAVVGVGLENEPILLNIDKHPNVLIIGRRGSGAAMLLTTMLISLAYINKPSDMEIMILSPMGDRSLKYFDNLPYMHYPLAIELEDCLIKLHDLLKHIEERETKFKDAGAKTLIEFNKYQNNESNKLKTFVLVISSFDYLIRNSLQNLQLLNSILTKGSKVGVKVILLSINVNNETIEPKIYDETNARFILRLESERESLKIFDTYQGVQLNGNGDGYYFDTVANKKTRFQTCYLNANELLEIIKIIKTFYTTKTNISN